jgi:hypothetical protein
MVEAASSIARFHVSFASQRQMARLQYGSVKELELDYARNASFASRALRSEGKEVCSVTEPGTADSEDLITNLTVQAAFRNVLTRRGAHPAPPRHAMHRIRAGDTTDFRTRRRCRVADSV